MKKALIALVVVIVLVAAGFYLIFSNLNSLLAKAIERNGSEVTRADVGVSGVDVSIREGPGSIKDKARDLLDRIGN